MTFNILAFPIRTIILLQLSILNISNQSIIWMTLHIWNCYI